MPFLPKLVRPTSIRRMHLRLAVLEAGYRRRLTSAETLAKAIESKCLVPWELSSRMLTGSTACVSQTEGCEVDAVHWLREVAAHARREEVARRQIGDCHERRCIPSELDVEFAVHAIPLGSGERRCGPELPVVRRIVEVGNVVVLSCLNAPAVEQIVEERERVSVIRGPAPVVDVERLASCVRLRIQESARELLDLDLDPDCLQVRFDDLGP